ncbi:hypothetical protein C8R42DRAFT_658339 [Lentinula raphanica]|nr:hypothetical protein C8R42DRAFT_658339 [Lentinula raphanica]
MSNAMLVGEPTIIIEYDVPTSKITVEYHGDLKSLSRGELESARLFVGDLHDGKHM